MKIRNSPSYSFYDPTNSFIYWIHYSFYCLTFGKTNSLNCKAWILKTISIITNYIVRIRWGLFIFQFRLIKNSDFNRIINTFNDLYFETDNLIIRHSFVINELCPSPKFTDVMHTITAFTLISIDILLAK